MISDHEMKYINSELSANPAGLIRILHDDGGGSNRLLRLIYEHPAMLRWR